MSDPLMKNQAMGMMEAKKPYLIVIVIQLIYAGLFVVSKAALDHGMNTFVFIFYRMAAASLLLLPVAIILERKNVRSMSLVLLLRLFFYALIGNTLSLNLCNVSIKWTSATFASATGNAMPVITFCLALLLRMEAVKTSRSGMAKLAGVALCVAGVFVLAFYTGPALSPVNHHRAFAVAHASNSNDPGSRMTQVKGTFFMVLGNISWALWIILQSALLKEYPNKMLMTVTVCVFSTVQSFVVAVVAERDFSKWKLRFDISLLAIVYTGFVVIGVSYYLQAWCMQMKGPVFLAMSTPLCFVFTIFCSSFFLGEIVHLGSILGGALLVAGLYSVLWGKIREGMESEEEEEGKEEQKDAAKSSSSMVEQA